MGLFSSGSRAIMACWLVYLLGRDAGHGQPGKRFSHGGGGWVGPVRVSALNTDATWIYFE